jgi:glycosyltransferase involved in cell wall biosynthesis
VPAHHDRIRVGLDAHVVGHQRTGNETYVLGLAHALVGHPEIDLTAYVDRGVDWPIDGQTSAPRLRRLIARRPEPRIALELPLRAVRDRLDVLHVQYVAPLISSVPIATIVHDLSFFDVPDDLSAARRWRLRILVALAARGSKVVITPSEFSRERLLHHVNVPPERVMVAPPAVLPPADPPDAAGILAGLHVPARFILAVGDVHPRKNHARLIEATAQARRQGLDISLVIAGQRGFQAGSLDVAVAANDAADWVHLLGYVDREALGALYRAATVVAYVSTYEGFGLPVVEAMAAGTPVVASGVTSVPEVAGDGAVLVDPTSVDDICRGLLAAATDEALRERLIVAGRLRAEAYGPDAVVGATLAAYRHALGS